MIQPKITINMKKLKLISLALSTALFASGLAVAQDKALLNTLVNKGVITQEEASQIAKESVVVRPAQNTVRSLTFQGRIQTQYEYIQVNETQSLNNAVPAAGRQRATNDFIMRRLFLGATADLGSGWSGVITADFAATSTGAGGRNYIVDAYVRKAVDVDYLRGRFDVGYRKVNFGQEENTGSANLLAVERSLATNYFTGNYNANGAGTQGRRLGFGNRGVGLFWDGTVPQVEGLGYGLAVTTNQNQTFQLQNAASNTLAFWANLLYRNQYEGLKYTVGVNYGYKPKGSFTGTTANPVAFRSAWGVNPYLQLEYDAALLRAEYLFADVENGQTTNPNSQGAAPQGANIFLAYTFDLGASGKLQPVFRYSYLQTNGRGIAVSDGIRNANNGVTAPYNSAYSLYGGFNWLILGNAVKLSAGLEYAEFSGFTAAQSALANQKPQADVLAVRAQLQLLF